MSKKIQLTIAEPCHENWDGMSTVEKGRFCGSCQKQVVDFSNMSDRQVADFFKKPILSLSKGGSVCGRFMTDQLDRAIEIPRKRIPWMKYFFQIAIPAFLVSIKASASKTQGQIQVKTATKDTTRRPVYNDMKTMGIVARPQTIKPFMGDTIVTPVKEPVQILKGEIAVKNPVQELICLTGIMGGVSIGEPISVIKVDKNDIKGRVVNAQGEPIPFASIEVGNGVGMMADENGVFVINKRRLKKGSEILVSSVGFETEKIIAGKGQYEAGELYVQLKSNVVLDEVVVTSMGITMSKMTVGSVTRVTQCDMLTDKNGIVTSTDIIFTTNENKLLIYPNPVVSGATVNLSLKNLDENYYQLRLISQSGQLVKQQELWIDAEARLLNIDVPVVVAGSYFMVLTNKKTGKKFTEKIIIR